MAKCANCENDAFYVYQVTETFGIEYCSSHVPAFLQSQKQAGLLKTTAEFEAAKEEALASIAVVSAEETKTTKSNKKKDAEVDAANADLEKETAPAEDTSSD
jgi:hypothetical protein